MPLKINNVSIAGKITGVVVGPTGERAGILTLALNPTVS